jgi:hypothetical protein
MQSGAFIQLLLTLCGISARARALVAQLVDIIDVCRKHYAVIIQVLKANSVRTQSILLRPETDQDTAPTGN